MANFETLKREWIRPVLFYGNNPTSLLGGAITTAAAMVLVGYWVVSVLGHGGSSNPYIGIIFELILPAVFIGGLLLIFMGIVLRRRHLVATNQVPTFFPELSLQDPVFRHGIDFVIVATLINFIIVGTASYRGVAYMDTRSFCGTTCHVMQPQFVAAHMAGHAGVACTECHVAPGPAGYVHAKVNGTKQMLMVLMHNYPRPIHGEGKIPAAGVTCLNCHNPTRSIGDRLKVETAYGDDEKNLRTSSVTLLHVGGSDTFGHLSGIHGAHMGKIEYIATDAGGQTIPWVGKINGDGSVTEFLAGDSKGQVTGEKHVMDCLDCHNRPAHSFSTPENALDARMAQGSPSATLPFIHKEGLALLKAKYDSQDDAKARIASGLAAFYQTQYSAVYNSQRAQVDDAAKTLGIIYANNVFPAMQVGWGTYPNNIGHNDSPGCFRCHDGGHTAKNGTTITNDCSTCHNLVVSNEANPKLLTDLGLQAQLSSALPPPLAADDPKVLKGQAIFAAQTCNACHGDAGKGTPAGGPLTGLGAKYTDAQLATLLANPNNTMAGGGMTPLTLKPAEVDALTGFLRQLH